MPYTQTYILLVTDGTHGDATARSNAGKLKWKGVVDETGNNVQGGQPTRILLEDTHNQGNHDCDGDATQLVNVTHQDRLCIVGHGSYGDNPTVGSKSPQQLAQYLWNKGLRQAQRVTLVSCNSGWGWGDVALVAQYGYTSAAKIPFGKLFADELHALGIHTDVVARIGYVTVLQSGRKKVEMIDWRFRGNVVVPKGYNKRTWQS